MVRRIWVIVKKDEIEQSDIDAATLNGCTEIVNGIPPALQHILSEGQLPYAYEEPVLIESEPPRDLLKEIDKLNARLTKAGVA